MEINIHAGMRVLYKKNNSNWLVGEIHSGTAIVNEDGVFLPILTEEAMKQIHALNYSWEEPDVVKINIKDIYFDGFKIDDWVKEYKKYFMTKEEYIKFIESDEFDKRIENACVSDGEYGYYPISKYTRTWVEKQPFEYVVRGD